MAEGKRKHDRENIINHAAIIWRMAGGEMTKMCTQDFLRYGQMGSGATADVYDPEVEKKVAEIQANGGKLIVEVPNG